MGLFSSLGSFGGSVVQAVSAIKSGNEARKAANAAQEERDRLLANRPQYAIPDEYGQNQKLSKSIMDTYEPGTKSSILTGQGYMQNQVDANSANANANAMRSGVSSPSQYSSILTSSLQAQNDAQTKMGIAGAQQRLDYQDKYADASDSSKKSNLDMADQKEFQWDQNVFSPYQTAVQLQRDKLRDETEQRRYYNEKQLQAQKEAQVSGGESVDSIYSPTGGKSKGGQSIMDNPSMDSVNARAQGVSKSWQERGRGYTKR
ncbi:MAG: hypothetical protein ACH350_09285 [Parachlamydiaceae bacterium]